MVDNGGATVKKENFKDKIISDTKCSLSSDQVFLSIPLKPFSKFSGWTFKCFFLLLLNCSIAYFIYL